MGEKMRSKEKIKVFISSKCGGERINYDKLVEAESSDKKAVASKAVRTSYDLIRRALKTSLEETGLFKVYIFEDDHASTSAAGEDYIIELDNSHVCLFLIDNFDEKISEGLLNEITRAQKTNKKSFYLFLNDPNREITSIQENILGVRGAHFYEVRDIREFIDKGYQSITNDIVKKYQNYCDGKIDLVDKTPPSVEITNESFPIDTIDIDKQIFKNLGETKNKIISLIYHPDEKETQTSDLDKLCLSILEVLLGEKKFEDVNLPSLLKTLSEIQSPKVHEVVSRRWAIIASLFNGDLDAALTNIEAAYNTFSEDVSIPKWLINDILIDWRNLKTIDIQIKNIVYDSLVQEKINQQNSLIFFPLTDRFSTNINDDIWDRNFKAVTGSPYSTTYYNLEHLFGYISNYLFGAIYYGSYTHIVFTLKEIQKALFDLIQIENNLLYKIQLMKISILLGDESSFNNIASKYGSSLSHSTTREILELYELANTKPLRYEKIKWKIILFREFGYYFSDTDYEIISNELLGFSREWIQEDNTNIFLGEKLFKALKSNIRRLSQETVVVFSMEILDKKYYRFFDSVFELLSDLDFPKLSKELTKRLLSQIDIALGNEDKKRDYQHIKNLLINMRRGQDNFHTEIDEIAERYYPEFYKRDYNLEIFPEKRDTHIQRYISNIKIRNKTQGEGGRFIGFVDRPYYIVRRIIELENPLLSEELLDDLLETIFNTLSLETQTHAEKIDAIELMMTLKRQELSYIYNWDDYYSKLEQHFSEIEKGHSGFFMKDESLSLRLHLIFIRINFDVDCLQELLEILALINSSEEYEIISSLISLKDFLSFEIKNLVENPVMPILVQYISSFCFHESHDVRYRTVQALYMLIESRYADFVVNRLSKMIDDDDYKVRWAVLHQVSMIKKINELTYNYIVGKAKIDNNYLVRRVVENYA
ncbi:MAG: hypothetical protein Q8L41_10260 [Anaerolineales bacterium]|nr:hypothetical protein [Anaerolineales bacterium]